MQPATDAHAALAVEQVQPISMPDTVSHSGFVRAWARVELASKIMGRIERLSVREGDRVERGQRLVVLEQRDLQAAVSQAQAAVAMARAQLDNASVQHRRMESLHQRGSVTDKNLEDAQAAHRVALAALEQAEANLAATEVQLGYAQLESPISGWIVARHRERGDVATPGSPLLTIEDLSRVKIVLDVAES
ncbi:MAG: efflux RND transporter periplasmic adaptor subunit, partial [Acidobacteriota bacterium]